MAKNIARRLRTVFEGTSVKVAFPFAELPIGKMMQATKRSISDGNVMTTKIHTNNLRGRSMTANELGKILDAMYNGAEEGEKVTMIHLFGIKYAEEIRESGIAAKDIAESAKIPVSYGTEISKGVRLARHVRPIH